MRDGAAMDVGSWECYGDPDEHQSCSMRTGSNSFWSKIATL